MRGTARPDGTSPVPTDGREADGGLTPCPLSRAFPLSLANDAREEGDGGKGGRRSGKHPGALPQTPSGARPPNPVCCDHFSHSIRRLTGMTAAEFAGQGDTGMAGDHE